MVILILNEILWQVSWENQKSQDYNTIMPTY